MLSGFNGFQRRQVKQARREWSQYTTQRRCYKFEEFVESCHLINSFTALELTPETVVRSAVASVWSHYPPIVNLLYRYLEVAEVSKPYWWVLIDPEAPNIKVLNIRKCTLESFSNNFLKNIQFLGVDFKTPAYILKKRARKEKARELKRIKKEQAEQALGPSNTLPGLDQSAFIPTVSIGAIEVEPAQFASASRAPTTSRKQTAKNHVNIVEPPKSENSGRIQQAYKEYSVFDFGNLTRSLSDIESQSPSEYES